MFGNLELVSILLLSTTLYGLCFWSIILWGEKYQFLRLFLTCTGQSVLQWAMTAHVKDPNWVDKAPDWIMSLINFFKANPIVPVVMTLVALGAYLATRDKKSDYCRIILSLSIIILSFLLSLTLSKPVSFLISAKWAVGLVGALLIEILLFNFLKRRTLA